MKVIIKDTKKLNKDDYKTILSFLNYLKETNQVSGDLTREHLNRIAKKLKEML